VAVAGLVVVRQRPGTASGVVFMSLEDETGLSNVVIWPDVFERFRREMARAPLLLVTGTLQRAGLVANVVAARLEPLALDEPRPLRAPSRDFH
jgi:error-prone DNA polymerase